MTFEEFVRSDSVTLLRFAVALTGDRGLAEDLVQDTLVKAFRSWHRIETTDQPWSYVRRMLVNEHVSWRRKWSRIVPVADVGLISQSGPSGIEGVADRDLVLKYLRLLPARQRAAVVLHYLEDMPTEQIADVLGCRPATVRAYLSKAMTTLRGRAPAPGLIGRPAS